MSNYDLKTIKLALKPDMFQEAKNDSSTLFRYLKSEAFEELHKFLNDTMAKNPDKITFEEWPRTMSEVDYKFREILLCLNTAKALPTKILKELVNFEKQVKEVKSNIKSMMESFRLTQQKEYEETQKIYIETEINRVNNLSLEDLEDDQIDDEQVRVMQNIEKLELESQKVSKKFIKSKLLSKNIVIKGFNNNINSGQIVDLFHEGFLNINEIAVKNHIKEQYDTNNTIVLGISGIDFTIEGNN